MNQLQELAQEKLIDVDVLGHKFKFDVADVDIEALQRMEDFAKKAQGQVSLEMFDELQAIFSLIIGQGDYEKAMQGKKKSIKTFAQLAIAVGEILTQVNAHYAKLNKRVA